jgi:hypothetical protein
MGEISKIGDICAPWTEFPMDLDQTKVTQSIYEVFLRLYQRGETLGSKVGRWCTEMQSPGGLNFENGRDLCTTEPIHHGFGSNEGCRVHL